MSSCVLFFVFKQKAAYEVRSSDWSSDVCSSDFLGNVAAPAQQRQQPARIGILAAADIHTEPDGVFETGPMALGLRGAARVGAVADQFLGLGHLGAMRSEAHTSELQSLMRNSYAVFCLKKKKTISQQIRKTMLAIPKTNY